MIFSMTDEERSRFAEYRDRQRGGPPRAPQPHGTPAAAMRHRRAGEPLCAECIASEKARQQALYQARKAKATKKKPR